MAVDKERISLSISPNLVLFWETVISSFIVLPSTLAISFSREVVEALILSSLEICFFIVLISASWLLISCNSDSSRRRVSP